MSDSNRPYKGDLVASFRHAAEGLAYVIKQERNARIHLIVASVVILLSAWLRLSRVEWALIITAIGMVFAGEMLNTVVELTVDLITVVENPLAKHAKDVAAGAILVAAFVSVVLGIMILGPPLWQKLIVIWN